MKLLYRILLLLVVNVCLHSCAVDGFTRQKYTHFKHGSGMRLKLPDQPRETADVRNAPGEQTEELPPVAVSTPSEAEAPVVLLRVSSDSLLSVVAVPAEVGMPVTLSAAPLVSGLHGEKAEEAAVLQEQQPVVTDASAGNAAAGAFGLLTIGLLVAWRTTGKGRVDAEKAERLRRVVLIMLLVVASLVLLMGVSFLLGVFLGDFLINMGMLLGVLAALGLIATGIVYLCYRSRQGWKPKDKTVTPKDGEALPQLAKQVRRLSLIAYLMLIPFGVLLGLTIVAVAGAGGAILTVFPAILLAAFLTVLAIAVGKGQRYRRVSRKLGMEPDPGILNLHTINTVMLIVFGTIALLGAGVMFILLSF